MKNDARTGARSGQVSITPAMIVSMGTMVGTGTGASGLPFPFCESSTAGVGCPLPNSGAALRKQPTPWHRRTDLRRARHAISPSGLPSSQDRSFPSEPLRPKGAAHVVRTGRLKNLRLAGGQSQRSIGEWIGVPASTLAMMLGEVA